MKVTPIKTRIYSEKANLPSFIHKHVKRLPERSVLVITSKIMALAEGRTVLAKDSKAKMRVVRQESDAVLQTKLTTLTLKDGMLMAAGGVDESNALGGKLILLPRDSYKSARILRDKLRKMFKVKDLGVLITDSRTTPLRQGVTGVATGFAGFKGVRDYKGSPDIFGRPLQYTTTNVPDCLATAAVLVMGEGSERHPLALIIGAPIEFTDKKITRKDVAIAIEEDLYKPLLVPLLNRIKK